MNRTQRCVLFIFTVIILLSLSYSSDKAYADGAYDTSSCRKALEERGILRKYPNL